MFPRIQGLFHHQERAHHAQGCGAENTLTIISDHHPVDDEEDSSDSSSSGEHVEIEDKPMPIESHNLDVVDSTDEAHSEHCSCPNCDEIQSRFSECNICMEPLQMSGPCVCPWCGGVWCLRCTRKISRCAWCRGGLRSPAIPCLALQRLVNSLMLPCRNFRRGCNVMLTAATRVKHEEDCKYDTMMCPIMSECCAIPFEEIAGHLSFTHNIISVYSQKIKILVENFQMKLKKTACCKTKYKIILLHEKSAFIIKVCIYNYHVRVEVMRRRLGYVSDTTPVVKKSDYCAVVEFQSRAMTTKSAVVIENECYSKKAEVQWNDVALKSENDESITIHVTINKTNELQGLSDGIANIKVC